MIGSHGRRLDSIRLLEALIQRAFHVFLSISKAFSTAHEGERTEFGSLYPQARDLRYSWSMVCH